MATPLCEVQMEWRRVSDWKASITLVSLADVEQASMSDRGWLRPAEQLGSRWPRLASLADDMGFARVEGDVLKLLRAAGVTTYEVGYHRGSDGFLYREISGDSDIRRDVDVGRLLSLLAHESDEDEAFDRLSSDIVDALIRIFSESYLTERAVIVAALLPPLGAAGPLDSITQDLTEYEALEADQLPRIDERFLDLVATAVAQLDQQRHVTSEPALTPAVRRSYIKKASTAAAALLMVAFVVRDMAPGITAIAIALAICCSAIGLIHGAALLQERSKKGRRQPPP